MSHILQVDGLNEHLSCSKLSAWIFLFYRTLFNIEFVREKAESSAIKVYEECLCSTPLGNMLVKHLITRERMLRMIRTILMIIGGIVVISIILSLI